MIYVIYPDCKCGDLGNDQKDGGSKGLICWCDGC